MKYYLMDRLGYIFVLQTKTDLRNYYGCICDPKSSKIIKKLKKNEIIENLFLTNQENIFVYDVQSYPHENGEYYPNVDYASCVIK